MMGKQVGRSGKRGEAAELSVEQAVIDRLALIQRGLVQRGWGYGDGFPE